MTRALLGLGSNLDDRRAHLRAAVDGLPGVVQVSPVYETKPVGGPEQGPYLNLVVEIDTDLQPRALLAHCQELELQSGRVRRIRWGPRTLDVDILWMDGISVDEEDLVIPHPRMRDRAFVMIPLADVAPDIAAGWEGDDSDGVLAAGEL